MRIEATLSAPERESLNRALRGRPSGAEPLSVVDYLYLGQLPSLLLADAVGNRVRQRLEPGRDPKRRLQEAISQIAPVRNEIAHVREIESDRLMRADLACRDVLRVLGGGGAPSA